MAEIVRAGCMWRLSDAKTRETVLRDDWVQSGEYGGGLGSGRLRASFAEEGESRGYYGRGNASQIMVRDCCSSWRKGCECARC